MHVGISLEPPQPGADTEFFLRTARNAERLGYDNVLMSGHVLENRGGSALDPLVLLAAIAGGTTRIGLATSILVVPYYQPVILANQAASLDVLSSGRFVLGVGTGWNPDEFQAVGVPIGERGTRMDESLAVLKSLWVGDSVDFEGRFNLLRHATIGTRPLTPGGPPVWVGGASDAALRRALRFGDGWHGSGVDHAGVADVRRRLAALGEAAGRDPDTLRLTTVCFLAPPGIEPTGPVPGRPLGGEHPTAQSVLDDLGRLEDAGISLCSLWMPVAAEHLADALEWVAAEILPAQKR
jgi:probable F420-dependent oxidoreductase